MQERVGRKGNPPTLLVGLKIDKAIVKKQYGESLKKIKIELPYDPASPPLGIYSEKIIICKNTWTSQKQSKCTLTDEWKQKMWYITTQP